jgi:hypothetical protein
VKAKRRILSLVAGMALVVALGTAGSASAEPWYPTWSVNHQYLNKAAEIQLDGSLGWTSSFGGVSCPEASGSLNLSAGSGGGISLEVPSPGKCLVTGTLASFCGAHSLQNVVIEHYGLEGPLPIIPGEEEIIGTNEMYSTFNFEGCGLEMTLEGGQIFGVDNPTEISSLSDSSAASSSLGGSATWDIDMNLTPKAKYGIDPVSEELLEPEEGTSLWMKEGTQIVQNEVLEFHGDIGIEGTAAMGWEAVSCPVSRGWMEFEAGTRKGQLLGMEISKNECESYGYSFGSHMTLGEYPSPVLPLSNQRDYINLKQVAFLRDSATHYSTRAVTGELKVIPTGPYTELSGATFSGKAVGGWGPAYHWFGGITFDNLDGHSYSLDDE